MLSANTTLQMPLAPLIAAVLISIPHLSFATDLDSIPLDKERSNALDAISRDWEPNLHLLQLRSQKISRPSPLSKPRAVYCGDCGQSDWNSVLPVSAAPFSFVQLRQEQEEETPRKTIFLNSKYSGHLSDGPLECPSVRCTVTHDPAVVQSADAVVWNARWMHPLEAPHAKPAGQRWVFNFFFEAPIYKGERVNALETALVEGSGDVDWTMTYSPRSDIFSPIGRMVPVSAGDDPSLAGTTDYAAGRSHLLLWFVSNCDGARLPFFQQLQSLLPSDRVHVYGDCGEPSPCPGRDENDECHQNLFSKYKFYAAFENSRCDGYITEKFFRPFAEGMVPLVMGGLHRSDYEALAPKASFLDVDDFRSLSALAAHLMVLDVDDTAYNSFHSWRSSFRISNMLETIQHAFCELCQRLHNDPPIALIHANSSESHRQSEKGSLESWWYDNACRREVPEWFVVPAPFRPFGAQVDSWN